MSSHSIHLINIRHTCEGFHRKKIESIFFSLKPKIVTAWIFHENALVSFIPFLCGAVSCHVVVEEMRLLCSKHDARLQTILRDMLRFIIAHYISDVDKRHTSKIKQIVAGICTCGDITLVNCALQVSQQLGSNVVRTARIGYSNIWSYLVF